MGAVAIEMGEVVSEMPGAGRTTVLTGTRVVLICFDLAESEHFDWPLEQPTTVTAIDEYTVEVTDPSEAAEGTLGFDPMGLPVTAG